MRERPILFSGEMVRAILDGRKSQTRRVINPRIYIEERFGEEPDSEVERVIYQSEPEFGAAAMRWLRCPYGQPGDRLWVRETFAETYLGVRYRADLHEHADTRLRFKSPIHMACRFSRITLEVTGVRVERVQAIGEDDAKAEGAELLYLRVPTLSAMHRGHSGWMHEQEKTYRGGFAFLWDSLNERRGYGWDANPWVWVIEFRRADAARGEA